MTTLEEYLRITSGDARLSPSQADREQEAKPLPYVVAHTPACPDDAPADGEWLAEFHRTAMTPAEYRAFVMDINREADEHERVEGDELAEPRTTFATSRSPPWARPWIISLESPSGPTHGGSVECLDMYSCDL